VSATCKNAQRALNFVFHHRCVYWRSFHCWMEAAWSVIWIMQHNYVAVVCSQTRASREWSRAMRLFKYSDLDLADHTLLLQWFFVAGSATIILAFITILVLWRCWLGGRKGIRPVKKLKWWDYGVVICLGEVRICIWPSWCHRHSLSLATVNPDWCYLPGFTFLVLAHPGSARQSPGGHKTVVVVVVVVVVAIMILER